MLRKGVKMVGAKGAGLLFAGSNAYTEDDPPDARVL